MKKFKIGASFFVLVAICLITKQFVLLINYLFALILHELAHLFVALSKGYHLRCIKLDMLGMSVELETDIKNKDVFAVNIAGPFVNLIMCVLCLLTYIINPNNFVYLNCFCACNMILSLFNLLPIYPLDGGKIFCGLINNYNQYKKLDKIIRIVAFFIFSFLFVWGCCYYVFNWYLLIIAVFFIVSKPNKKTSFSIFKTGEEKEFDKLVLLQVNESDSLINLIKKISNNTYTIFYLNNTKPKYFEEDKIINYALTYPLNASLKEIINK